MAGSGVSGWRWPTPIAIAGTLLVARQDVEAGQTVRTGAVLLRKWRQAARQPLSVIGLIPAAWMLIGAASLAVAVLPFRRIAPVLGRNLGTASLTPLASPTAMRRAIRIGQAISLAAKYMPARSDCLPQAMAGAVLCRAFRVPYAAYFGASASVAGREGELLAHAWVQSGQVTVSGGSGSFQHYGVVACFVAPGYRV